jgi:CBS domain-containing protein
MALVKDVMSKKVVSIDADAPILDAARLMKEKKIGSLIVYAQRTPAGIITERDFVYRVLCEEKDSRATKVGEVMSKPLISVDPFAPLEEVAEIMKNSNVRTVGVIYKGELEGVMTARDLMNAEAKDIKSLSKYVNAFFRSRG